jgi:restriction system protein
MTETTLWGIHAGGTGDADSLFRESGVIAIGWHLLGDLSQLSPTREAFKARLISAYPETKEGAIPTTAGMPFRFVHEIQVGDCVAYPSKRDRKINLGRVTSEYSFEPSASGGYVHQRKVEWICSISRTHFSQGALYEIGSALSLFQIKNYADEFFAALSGKASPVIDPVSDPSTGMVATQVNDTAEDFVLKTLARELKGLQFEHFVAHLLERMGFTVRLAQANQPGYDLIASRDSLGFEPPIIKVQVKSAEGTHGDPEVTQLLGKVTAGEFALFVTLGTVTKKARDFEESKANLRIIDGSELVKLIFEHYESFDSRYKGLLPLRRVYVPAPVEDE